MADTENDQTASAVPNCFQSGTMGKSSVCARAGTDDYTDDAEQQLDSRQALDQQQYAECGDMPSAWDTPKLAHLRGAPNLVTRFLTVRFTTTVGALEQGYDYKFSKEEMDLILQQKGAKGGRRGTTNKMFVVAISEVSYSKNIDEDLVVLLNVVKPREWTQFDGKLVRVNSVLAGYASGEERKIAWRRKMSSLALMQASAGLDAEKLESQHEQIPNSKGGDQMSWVHEDTDLFGVASEYADDYGYANDFGAQPHDEQRRIVPTKLIQDLLVDIKKYQKVYPADDMSKFTCTYRIERGHSAEEKRARVRVTHRLQVAALWSDPNDYFRAEVDE